MDLQAHQPDQTSRRRRKTKWELFKENTLPVLILLAAAVVILCFIFGAVGR